MRINNNIAALNTLRQYTTNTNATSKSMEKLSSGLRINRAGDDAAGLAISEKMRAQIRGIEMASKNSQDAISLVQTAEGALTETHSILQRMNELSIQASSDTNEDIDRDALQSEFAQLCSEIDDIASQTKFNNKYLLDGSYAGAKINEDSTIFTTDGLNTDDVTNTGNATAGVYANITYTAGSAANSGAINDGTAGYFQLAEVTVGDTAQGGTYSMQYTGGAWQVTREGVSLDVAVDGSNISFDGITIDTSTVNTANYAAALDLTVTAATFTADYATTDAGLASPTALTGTFDSDGLVTLKDAAGDSYGITFNQDAIGDMTSGVALGGKLVVDSQGGSLTIQTGANSGETLDISIGSMSATSLGLSGLNVENKENAQAASDAVISAINSVSTQRANLGAYQNRLEHKINNLDTSSENLQAAESRIRDVDMAQEMVEFTKNNILLQAAQSMLAQANAQPQGVLQLLQ